MAVYKIGTSTQSPAWSDPNEMPRQLALNNKYPEVKGSMFFSMKELLQNPLGFTDNLSKNIYKHPALVPPAYSADPGAPHRAILYRADHTSKGVQLKWADFLSNKSASYAIYRFAGNIHAHQYDFQSRPLASWRVEMKLAFIAFPPLAYANWRPSNNW
jgi:hypothetical protein